MNETPGHTNEKLAPSEWDSLFFHGNNEELLLNANGTRKSEYEESENGQREKKVEDELLDDIYKKLKDKYKDGKTKDEDYLSDENYLREQDKALEEAIRKIDEIRDEEYKRQKNQQGQNLVSVFQQIMEQKRKQEPAPAQPSGPAPTTPSESLPPIPTDRTNEPNPTAANPNHTGEPNHTSTNPDRTVEPNPTAGEDHDAAHQELKELKELEELKRQLAEIDEQQEANRAAIRALKPDFAISVGYDKLDGRDLARDLAERTLDEASRANFIKRLFMGKLFRRKYLERYTYEYKRGFRTVNDDPTLDVFTLANRYNSANKNIADEISQDDISHNPYGMVIDDKETTNEMVQAIVEYSAAKANLPEGKTVEELGRDLAKKLRELAGAEGGYEETYNNYLKLADQISRLIRMDGTAERVKDEFEARIFRLIIPRDDNQRFDLNRIFTRIEYDSAA